MSRAQEQVGAGPACLYVDPELAACARFRDERLDGFSERHHFTMREQLRFEPFSDLGEALNKQDASALIVVLPTGLPSRSRIRLLREGLKRELDTFVYWPAEDAIERVDDERLSSFVRHRIFYLAWNRLHHLRGRARALLGRSGDLTNGDPAGIPAMPGTGEGLMEKPQAAPLAAQLSRLAKQAAPVDFHADALAASPLPGTGVYLRLDFWAKLTCGGSYGHTCYQAAALAERSEDFVCVLAQRYALLDGLGIRQVVVPAANEAPIEVNLLTQNEHFYRILRPMMEALRPTYIFERLVLGSYVGARLSQELGIPYIAEYNGSEIAMLRSFANGRYQHETLLTLAEEAAFRQASLVSVISDHVGADVAERGAEPGRIFVNPNGVDLDAYRPASEDETREIRAGLGLAPDDMVAGFIGTFGGWHGIDVLSEALPLIAERAPDLKFLMIGDGPEKPRLRESIARHGLEECVIDLGRVEQTRGAALLRACNILLSPHSRHMGEMKFFGSPTKLFEYMAVGGGIVASDLEQIGQVLKPALTVADLSEGRGGTDQERAVLCRPGDVGDFVEAVVALAERPELAEALGRNARAAAQRYYSWDQHAASLWNRLAGREPEGFARDLASKGL